MLMGSARKEVEDGRNATLMALIANVNRDPKKRSKPFTTADFMPGEPTPPPKGDFSQLKSAFIRKR